MTPFTRRAIPMGWLFGLASLLGAQSHTVYTVQGDAPHDLLGIATAGVGDVDGDGTPDFAVGAYEAQGSTGMVKVLSGRTGLLLLTLRGSEAGERFGCAVAGVGDIDRDGHADVLVGSYMVDRATLFSGRTGLPLWRGSGAAGSSFGLSVGAAGDVDRDGVPDWIVGAPLDDAAGEDSGCAVVYSGRSGGELWRFHGAAPHDWFGYAVNGAGDVDRDGAADLIVGACYEDLGFVNTGSARVYSGRSGAVLHTFAGSAQSDWFGVAVACAGDLDRDGHDDIVVGASGADDGGPDSGSATAFSGRTGKVLFHWVGALPGDEFGVAVAGGADLDGDRRPDVVVGAYRGSVALSGAGSVYAFSGHNGKQLVVQHGENVDDRLGVSVALLGDLDGDGYGEFAAGAVYSDLGGRDAGCARVFSFAARALTANVLTISVATGGTQVLSIDVGPEHAGRSFLLLGSASGTAPGFKLQGVEVPLRFDNYTQYTTTNLNSSLLLGSPGTLDALGRGTARLQLPTGMPASLVGTTLFHAAVVYDNKVRLATNAAPVNLLE